MRNTWLVMRQELYKILHSKGYIIFAFGVPVVVVVALFVGYQIFRQQSSLDIQNSMPGASTYPELQVEGYVDQSKTIQRLPDNIPSDHLVRFESEALAQLALESGKITAYYLIPGDVIEDGRVFYVYPNTRSYLDDGQSWVISWTLTYNLLHGDAEIVSWVGNPVWDVTLTDFAPQGQTRTSSLEDCSRPNAACRSNDLVRYMPSLMTAIFFIAFMSSSSRLFNSIGKEKENRVLEVLLLAVSPRQLLAGKSLGLGLAGLMQTAAWLGAIYIAFNKTGSILSLPDNFTFPLDILFWSLVLFLGGYGLYANLMAGAGALVPKMKEAGVANYIVTFPLFIGYTFGLMAPLAEIVDSPLMIFLSIFPLTSPTVMVMRLTHSAVPTWQLLCAIGLLFLSAIFVLRSVADLFTAQNLLSGQPFSLRRYIGLLLPNKQSH